MKPLPRKPRELPAGVPWHFAQAILFADWCDFQRSVPSYQAIMSEFRISRATAYRWLDAWKAVRGNRVGKGA